MHAMVSVAHVIMWLTPTKDAAAWQSASHGTASVPVAVAVVLVVLVADWLAAAAADSAAAAAAGDTRSSWPHASHRVPRAASRGGLRTHTHAHTHTYNEPRAPLRAHACCNQGFLWYKRTAR